VDCFFIKDSMTGVSYLPPIIAALIFGGVILSIALNLLDLAVAGLLGAMLLRLLGIISSETTVSSINVGFDTIGLFFGGMVMARALVPTGIFDYLGARVLRLIRGDGRWLLLSIVVLTAPICAILPNATVVILFAPLLIRVCRKMGIDFGPPIMLLVFVANSSGLLSLVGDPATFIVGNSIQMTFASYLYYLSLGGLLSLIALVLMLPILFRSIWRIRVLVDDVEIPKIEHVNEMIIGLVILAVMVTLFIFGESLPVRLGPPAVVIVGASLMLLTIYLSGIDTVSRVLSDVDWETLLFFIGIFVMVGALDSTGVIAGVGSRLRVIFGAEIASASMIILSTVGLLSSTVPNIPLVVAMVPIIRQYATNQGWATAAQLAAGYRHMPAHALSLFYAMMYGATLGGNGTLFGASSNIVAVGICVQEGRALRYAEFARYGIPVMIVQLLVSAIYLRLRFLR
jgi:Na+/H+ antiporter NhaD/arsenite permease-like protein